MLRYFIAKFAEYIGYQTYSSHPGEKFHEWRCPRRDCGMSVSEDYQYCPYCGQKLKFEDPENMLRSRRYNFITMRKEDYKSWRD